MSAAALRAPLVDFSISVWAFLASDFSHPPPPTASLGHRRSTSPKPVQQLIRNCAPSKHDPLPHSASVAPARLVGPGVYVITYLDPGHRLSLDCRALHFPPFHLYSSSVGLVQTQAVTISTPIRIQSILSPPDPPDSDDAQTNSSYHSSAKRRYDDSSVPPDAPLVPPTPPAPPDRRLSSATDLSQGSGVGGVARGYGDHEMKPMLAGLTFESKKGAKMRPPMRSSIACLRCRKSKIKCENNGGTSPCDSCLKTGKDCVFKLPEPNQAPPKRNDPPSAIKQERDGGSDRKKLKKIDELSKLDNEKGTLFADEVLSAPFLTEDIWDQVLDLYKLHFAPELPFLHLPTMKEKLGRRFRSQLSDPNPDFNLVLLGILTLTARYHTDLVKYLAHICNSQGGNARSRPVQTQVDPAAASEYYAETLTRALGSMRNAMGSASVERVQALLMLGLYEWGQTRPNSGGLGAWMFVGIAVRMAHFLKLGLIDRDFRKIHRQLDRPSGNVTESQLILEREINRRTMWSCFVLDRMLACGKERLAIVDSEKLIIQLPCSEDKFDLEMDASTGFLKSMPSDPRVTDDSVLSRFVQLVSLWGDISRYSVDGGRVTDQDPPWDSSTAFYKLRERLFRFEENLPGTFTFSRSNYFKHENHQASSVYVLLHMLRNVYIPFVPIRCREPEGPLDSPVFPKEQTPDGFWLDSAEQVFRAAREIIDLIEICQKKDKLPQSTIVLFAIWTAAFVVLYAIHFEQMDVHRHVLSHVWNEPPEGEKEVDVFRHGPLGLTYTTLSKMSICLNMATTYITVLQKMDTYFVKIRRDYDRHVDQNRSLSEKISLSVRWGGKGGGLEEYKKMPLLKELGHLAPLDLSAMEDRSRASTIDRASPVDSRLPPINRGQTPRSTASTFTAINHASSTPYHEANGSSAGHPQDSQPESWNHQSNTLRPIQSYASSAVAMLGPESAGPPSSHHDDVSEYELESEEKKRFNVTNDLGILTQNNDPWIDGQLPFFDLSADAYGLPHHFSDTYT
ncbi:putative Fungal-specific transcription factor domain-containing protein [Seiridium unicorne]|uniref:Fungal-specific transcription factor domain-containing protein n=1 Tax=Seiridium unicorne TaxID=138068 RepID=A0ABR2V7E8_9PEZI